MGARTRTGATSNRKLARLLTEVRACRVCEQRLPLGPRPILNAHVDARILIAGQAPGTKVHETGIPWNDPSGNRLREWMAIDRDTFYNARRIAIIPMGYCYPGRGASGDLPPRRECAELWLDRLLAELPNIELTLLIGQYAQAHYLGPEGRSGVAETVKQWQSYLPKFLPLPHPSPRNIAWFRRHPWFEVEVVPALRKRLRQIYTDLN